MCEQFQVKGDRSISSLYHVRGRVSKGQRENGGEKHSADSPQNPSRSISCPIPSLFHYWMKSAAIVHGVVPPLGSVLHRPPLSEPFQPHYTAFIQLPLYIASNTAVCLSLPPLACQSARWLALACERDRSRSLCVTLFFLLWSHFSAPLFLFCRHHISLIVTFCLTKRLVWKKTIDMCKLKERSLFIQGEDGRFV